MTPARRASREGLRPLQTVVVVLVLAALVAALVQVRDWAGLNRHPLWVARTQVRDLAVTALSLINPVYAGMTSADRQGKKDLVFSMHHTNPGATPSMPGSVTDSAHATAAIPDSADGAMPGCLPDGVVVNILVISNQNAPDEDPLHAFTFHVFRMDLSHASMSVITLPGTAEVRRAGEAPMSLVQSYLTRGYAPVLEHVRRACGLHELPYYICLSANKTRAIITTLGLTVEQTALERVVAMRRAGRSDAEVAEATGLFARDLFLHILPLVNGLSGELLVRAGLTLIDNNIPRDVCLGLIYTLNDAGIPRDPAQVRHELWR